MSSIIISNQRKATLIAFLLMFFFLNVHLAYCQQNEDIKKQDAEYYKSLYDNGQSAAKSGNYDDAIRNFQELYEKDSTDYKDVKKQLFKALGSNGYVLYNKQNYGSANQFIERALKLYPNESNINGLMGMNLYHLEQDKSVTVKPDPLVYFNKALETEHNGETRAYYFFLMGRACQVLKNNNLYAIQLYNRVIRMDSGNVVAAYLNLVTIYGGDLAKNRTLAREGRPLSKNQYKDYEKAIDCCEKAAVIDSKTGQYFFWEGEIQEILGNLDKANDCYKKACQRESSSNYCKELAIGADKNRLEGSWSTSNLIQSMAFKRNSSNTNEYSCSYNSGVAGTAYQTYKAEYNNSTITLRDGVNNVVLTITYDKSKEQLIVPSRNGGNLYFSEIDY